MEDSAYTRAAFIDTCGYDKDSDIEYDRWLETGEIGTIADYSLEDWTDDYGYDITDPKHPNRYDICSEISDSYDPFLKRG